MPAQILPLSIPDLPAIRNLQPENWYDIIPNTRFYLHTPFSFPVKAVLDGEIVGTGCAILHGETCWLANIIVHPECRNQGIGAQITSYLMKLAKEELHCESILLIATEFGKPVYAKLGFEVDMEYQFFRKSKVKDVELRKEIVPFTPEYAEAVYALDRYASGEQRQQLLSLFIAQSWLFVEDKKLKGFYFPTLGEGLVIAENDEAGIALLQLHLLEEKHIVLPSTQKNTIQFLEQNGFVMDARVGTRMQLGKKTSWHPEHLYSRIGGNLG